MRQNFSSPTLSPLPPYPASSPPKEPPASPAPSPPSSPPAPEPSVPASDENNMRATHIRPRTAPASPERPGTAYSTRSTIRQVEPSPDSLSDALALGFAHGGTPAPGTSFEPFSLFNPGQDGKTEHDEHGMHHSSIEPTAPVVALRRGGTPSGRSSPRKSRSCSPQKSRSASPRKQLVRTPTLPVHQESSSSACSAVSSEKWEAPDTPSPIPHEQQREAYAPLQVRRPFAESNSEGEPVAGHDTHPRIADYMRKMMQQQQGARSKPGEINRSQVEVPEPVKRVVGPPAPHIVQAMVQPDNPSQTLSPFFAAQRQAQKEPARHISVSRRSEASGASVASKHSIFSTPGRDEMERKKPIVEEDEGPFATATSMQDLEQRRRRVSEGSKDGDGIGKRVCGMKCVVM
ncbi:hypothetical protein BU25DRAFT_463860 [Macroventuria anomochaeta]|uniref:Uncharacterized protein n=1 Tax=Macroventuria anomochaeta TaxID=301207 RepID=A0ACB6RHT5_9PLEO|nr:uncharacterized protein BU25DRAFT_463860 [Macroventuria anomochaeta]KAF2621257.1 hypothetical protein BU25DRAFT_463860 [Macroventuria anomochaeta]